MKKIEELKALMAEEKKWLTEYINARNANDDKGVVASFRLSFRLASKMRLTLSEELLPQLIAVAEAADAHIEQLEEGEVNYFKLVEALLPLTKDAGK
jgi:hypothetical protein